MAPTEEQLSELIDKLLAVEEAEEWDAFTEAARKALREPGDSVTVPAAFLRRAIGQIGATPLVFDHMKAAWNRVADELGLPEERK